MKPRRRSGFRSVPFAQKLARNKEAMRFLGAMAVNDPRKRDAWKEAEKNCGDLDWDGRAEQGKKEG